MQPITRSCPASRRSSRSGFTLTEIMIASAISLVVIAAVLAVVLAVTKSTRKTQFLAEALQNTREVQEHLKREISYAIKKDTVADDLGLAFDIANGSGRYARLTYRVPVSNPLRVAVDAAKGSSTLVLTVPAGVRVAPGDYVVMSLPRTGNRLRVIAVTDTGASADRDVTLTLSQTIESATDGEKIDVVASSNIYVSVYRDRKYEATDPGAAAVTTLKWWENASDDSTARVLSDKVAASARYMFEPVPSDLAAAEPADEHAVRWRYHYAGNDPVSGLLPGPKDFWESNETEGVLWARSGDPENPTGYSRTDDHTTSTTSSTTSTSTTSTTSTSTSTTSTTSIKTTSTTKTSTTSTTSTSTSTTSTTSIKTTSTTKTTTTSIKTTSTTKTTTTSIKTTSTTKTTTTSIKTTSTTAPTTTSVKTTSTTAPTTTKPPTTVPTSFLQDG